MNTGQVVPATAVSGAVSHPFAEYTPTLVELSIVVGAFAIVALLYTLAERYLDMSEHLGGHGAPEEVAHPAPAGEPSAPAPAAVAASATQPSVPVATVEGTV